MVPDPLSASGGELPLLTLRAAPLQTVAVPPAALAIAVVVLGSLLVAVVIVTVGYSLRAARRRRRRRPIRADLRPELLDRLYGRDEPGWSEWVGELSAAERDELESLLDVYLRELDGRDADRLAGLGVALGIDERARREVADGDYWDRIHALVWLALLRDAPDRSLLETHCRGTPRERAAAARVLYAAEVPDLATTGIDLLLEAEPRSFSVFGIDTLYRVSESDPAPLFDRAAADFETWEPALQQQVLLVTRHLHTVVGGADLSWVIGALSAPEPRVRAAAWRALDAYGWNRGLRDDIGIDPAADEPVPSVRASAYRTLGAWGDAEAVTALRTAAASEPDDRARVALAEALFPHRGPNDRVSARRDADGPADPFDVAWRWTSEHARFDGVARDISRRQPEGARR
ncbi:HEAT repeat domain-containing protein [Halorubrum persicum]|uniref:HEAT repeat domain-containing protein n=1 Tax=Halorubrum persicum TaxID=1383844 RepID=UPI001FE2CF9A|nr:HEAT repeat domain-containing protein [Halorubrum persicum]